MFNANEKENTHLKNQATANCDLSLITISTPQKIDTGDGDAVEPKPPSKPQA